MPGLCGLLCRRDCRVAMLGQHSQNIGARARLAEQEALHLVASLRPQGVPLLCRLDALGVDGDLE